MNQDTVKQFGVVYTPEKLADFVSELLFIESEKELVEINNILDPSCGEAALLRSMSNNPTFKGKCFGIDIDRDAIEKLNANSQYTLIHENFIMPRNAENTEQFWKENLPEIDCVIANPPWTTEKQFSTQALSDAGFVLSNSFYDVYVLFIELSIKLLKEGGFAGFIIPDSIFEINYKALRKKLLENTSIKVVARLGEKIFKEVNRATTVIIVQKKESKNNKTQCFRLDTESRREFLSTNNKLIQYFRTDKHEVLQKRFMENNDYLINVDLKVEEEKLIEKIKQNRIDFGEYFHFGRGVEISKKGELVVCNKCGKSQGFTPKQIQEGKKVCSFCNEEFFFESKEIIKIITDKEASNSEKIYVGENIKRYKQNGNKYIRLDVKGVNYKTEELYNPPKILIRKTGLGIYASIDYTKAMTTQTVYILNQKKNTELVPLEYFLALLNSRVVYFYYLKAYGENEWKSYPYLTKGIIYSLPLKEFRKNENTNKIITLSKKLSTKYDYETDLLLEKEILKLYEITEAERQIIFDEINKMPSLSAIEEMKVIRHV